MAPGNPKYCIQCGSPLKSTSKFCPGCGRAIKRQSQDIPTASESTDLPPVIPGPTTRRPPARRRWIWTLAAAMLVLFTACSASIILFLRSDRPLKVSTLTAILDSITRKTLYNQTIRPSGDFQEIDTSDGFSITLPANLLDKPAPLKVYELTPRPDPDFPLPAETLGVYEVTLGDQHVFAEPVFLEFAYDPEELDTPLPAEYALAASFWDEGAGVWVETPSFVDTARQRLVVPTFHFSKFQMKVIKADGHIWNDYFSIYYNQNEYNRFLAQTSNKDYLNEVAAAFEETREKYDGAGFKPFKKISIVPHEKYKDYWLGGFWQKYNVYLQGSNLDYQAYRNKVTGKIIIPYDAQDIPKMTIAHELFHSVQSRYFTAAGLTDLWVTNRSWWMEGTAEYAAGGLAYPQSAGVPHSEMGGVFDLKYLEKSILHTPSFFVRASDRPPLMNSWLFHYLSTVKNLSFPALFIGVSENIYPDLHANLVYYLKLRDFDFNQVFYDYAGWFYLDAKSPYLIRNPKYSFLDALNALASKKDQFAPLKGVWEAQKFEHEFSFNSEEHLHSAQMWVVKNQTNPRPVIISVYERRWFSSTPESQIRIYKVPTGSAPANPSYKVLTEKQPVMELLGPDDALVIPAMLNSTSSWSPKVTVEEILLELKPLRAEVDEGESATFTAAASRIPENLTKKMSFEWEIREPLATKKSTEPLENRGGVITIREKIQVHDPGRYRVKVLLKYEGVTVAEAESQLTVNPKKKPSETPEMTEVPPPARTGSGVYEFSGQVPGGWEGEISGDGFGVRLPPVMGPAVPGCFTPHVVTVLSGSISRQSLDSMKKKFDEAVEGYKKIGYNATVRPFSIGEFSGEIMETDLKDFPGRATAAGFVENEVKSKGIAYLTHDGVMVYLSFYVDGAGCFNNENRDFLTSEGAAQVSQLQGVISGIRIVEK